ncbi:BnaCnng05230D [Brassica napus]|uniref:BnaCnng05230D protein n=1 Tax=Brassica napus TaxID=3708 RepID=A0A078GTF9_BRANA|nr:BnaCnng05230D [Brassica napus]
MGNIWGIFKPNHGASEPQKLPVHDHFLQPTSFIVDCSGCSETKNDAQGYFCFECNFYVHKECARSPLEINHPSHSHPLKLRWCGPPSYSDKRCCLCGETLRLLVYHCSTCNFSLDTAFCRLELNWRYGGYRCSICPDYVIHLRCATRDDVWDGIDLDGTLEEEEETEEPFQVACALPVYFDAFYICSVCDFVLHETCATLPRKLRHELHKHTLTLRPNTTPDEEHGYNLFNCTVCQRLCSGFKYVCSKSCDVQIDVRCCSIRELFVHESHPQHPLFLTSSEPIDCGACNEIASPVLNCVDCGFSLGYDCATLPNKACERKVNPSTRFYTCEDCSSTLHITCVIGEFTFWRPGKMAISRHEVAIIPNDFASRPYCYMCRSRCEDTSGIIYISEKHICSSKCLEVYIKFDLTFSKLETVEMALHNLELFRLDHTSHGWSIL